MLLIIMGNFNLSSFTLGKTKKTGQRENKTQKDKGKLWHVPFWKTKKNPGEGMAFTSASLTPLPGKCVFLWQWWKQAIQCCKAKSVTSSM